MERIPKFKVGEYVYFHTEGEIFICKVYDCEWNESRGAYLYDLDCDEVYPDMILTNIAEGYLARKVDEKGVYKMNYRYFKCLLNQYNQMKEDETYTY